MKYTVKILNRENKFSFRFRFFNRFRKNIKSYKETRTVRTKIP